MIIISIRLVGALYTAMTCRRQPDIKSLIAYASVSHIGLLLRRLMLTSTWSTIGRLTIIIAHGLASSALFALANSIYETTKTRRMVLTKGIISVAPSIRIFLFLASVSNIGAPPTINLAGEIILLTNLLNKTNLALIPIAFISFYTAAYSLILYTSTQHNTSPEFFMPLAIAPSCFNTSSILHLTPLFMFLLKPDLCSS